MSTLAKLSADLQRLKLNASYAAHARLERAIGEVADGLSALLATPAGILQAPQGSAFRGWRGRVVTSMRSKPNCWARSAATARCPRLRPPWPAARMPA